MKTKFALAIGFVALLALAVGSAQAAQTIRANIPFQFVVNGKALPAGEYDFVRNPNNQSIDVVPLKKGSTGAVALVVTRLSAEIHMTPKDTHIVFDHVGDTYFLSELWTGNEDGFLLHITKETHRHRSINIPS